MLRQRIAVAAAGIPLVLAVVWLGGLAFAMLLAALAVIGVYEFRNKAKGHGIGVTEPLAALVAVGFVLFAHLRAEGLIPPEQQVDALYALLIVLVFGVMLTKVVRFHREPGLPIIGDMGATVFAGLWIGAMLSLLVSLRAMPSPGELAPLSGWPAPYGLRLVLLLLLCTWVSDSAAYFVGRRWGRRPLSPASPNKTTEGAAGGLLGGLIVGLGLGAALGLPWTLGLGFGLTAGIAGPLGDLGKSAMKRELGVKDFGGWLPGHGGMLDRFDSLLINGPVAYLIVLMVG